MKRYESGFTLIELLIAIAIIGILAALAIPLYRGYAIRAQLTEVEHAMSVVEGAVTAYQREQGSWPSCLTLNEIRNSLGVGLDAISRIFGITVVNGAITVTIGNIDALVDGKTLILIPTLDADGSIKWSWGWSSDFPAHMRPKT